MCSARGSPEAHDRLAIRSGSTRTLPKASHHRWECEALPVRALADVLLFSAGAVLVVVVVDAAFRSFVLPRGVVVRLTRVVVLSVRALFRLPLRFAKTYEQRDRVMALYAPLSLLVLPAVWLVLVLTGFMLMFRAVDVPTFADAFRTSGSSLFTLGFLEPRDLPGVALAFTEAFVGLGLLALLIAYLPTIYGTFSRREVLVAQMSVRAGVPPSAENLLIRAHLIGWLENLNDVWAEYQLWFNEVEETHTSLSLLVFLRSPEPNRSWVTAAGAVLDAAALHLSTIDVPREPQAALLIRAGFLALRPVAEFFGTEIDADPAPTDPISIARDEYDALCDRMAAAGVPLVADRDQAWRDFAGWRVNYDKPLIALAGIVMAPYAMWSSDRSLSFRRPPLRRTRRRT
jgi:hypothetical protein